MIKKDLGYHLEKILIHVKDKLVPNIHKKSMPSGSSMFRVRTSRTSSVETSHFYVQENDFLFSSTLFHTSKNHRSG